MAPSQNAEMIKIRVRHFWDMVPHMLVPTQVYVTKKFPTYIITIPTHTTAKMTPPLSLYKKIWAPPLPLHDPSPPPYLPAMWTSYWAAETAVLHSAAPTGASTKTLSTTFRRLWEVLLRYSHITEPNYFDPFGCIYPQQGGSTFTCTQRCVPRDGEMTTPGLVCNQPRGGQHGKGGANSYVQLLLPDIIGGVHFYLLCT